MRPCVRACACVCVLVWVRACVRVCVYVCASARVFVYAWISASTRSILTGSFSNHFLRFFLCDGGSKIRFLIGPRRFCFISNFLFSQNLFLIFFNDRVQIFEFGWIAFERELNYLYFLKKKVSSYHGSFVINKNMFFLKAYNF